MNFQIRENAVRFLFVASSLMFWNFIAGSRLGFGESDQPQRTSTTRAWRQFGGSSQRTGKFLWQYSSKKMEAGRQYDWPSFGLFAAPYVEGDRLWFVSNRCEVVCLDTNGFRDGKNDGPVREELLEAHNEADVVWKYDMFGKLGVRPHNVANCSVTCADELLLVSTSNGVGEDHISIPNPDAPSFIALDRATGKLLWQDNSPGKNILHGQWSSPAFAVLGGVPQAIFAGGDGWLYSFDVRGIKRGESNLLWRFDCNPKKSKWVLGGRGTRNNILATPTIHNELVYISTGQDPEHGDGQGRLWCIDPTRRGDISSELVFNKRAPDAVVAHKRNQACEPDKGDFTRPNPNSGVVWHYDKSDRNGDGKIDFDETMHRAKGTMAIHNNLLVVADGSGLVHCLDAKNGHVHWVYDHYANSAGTPLVVDGKIYIGDEDGDVAILRHSRSFQLIAEISHSISIYDAITGVDNVLYVATTKRLYAIVNTK